MIICIPDIGVIRPDIIRLITTIYRASDDQTKWWLTMNLIRPEEFASFAFSIDGDTRGWRVITHQIDPITPFPQPVSIVPLVELIALHGLMCQEMAKVNT